MDYFAYISRNKVDMLYEQLPESLINELSIESEKESSIDLGIETTMGFTQWLPSILAKASYGRKGKIIYGRKIKETYAHKLEIVLLNLKKQNCIIDFDRCTEDNLAKIDYIFYDGEFTADMSKATYGEDGDICGYVTIKSELHIGDKLYPLILDCSLPFFSDTRNEKYYLHSGNIAFLERGVPERFRTVIKLTRLYNNTIFGSPLFLSHDSSSSQGF